MYSFPEFNCELEISETFIIQKGFHIDWKLSYSIKLQRERESQIIIIIFKCCFVYDKEVSKKYIRFEVAVEGDNRSVVLFNFCNYKINLLFLKCISHL